MAPAPAAHATSRPRAVPHEIRPEQRRPDVVDRDDVRVIQRASETRFIVESPPPLLVGRKVRRQKLDGNVTAESMIDRPIHGAHAAFAKTLADLVLFDAMSGTRRGVDDWRCLPTEVG